MGGDAAGARTGQGSAREERRVIGKLTHSADGRSKVAGGGVVGSGGGGWR
jgi:hypothetical protein